MMRWLLIISLLACPAITEGQEVQPGRWAVTSTVLELSVPDVPRFLQRMARGRASAEYKALVAGQGMEILLAPDPKARCTVDTQRIASGRYEQTLTCPQKQGGPVHIARAGTYDATGFNGRATVAGTAPKGAVRIVLSQSAARVKG